jgi:hypothetical protein
MPAGRCAAGFFMRRGGLYGVSVGGAGSRLRAIPTSAQGGQIWGTRTPGFFMSWYFGGRAGDIHRDTPCLVLLWREIPDAMLGGRGLCGLLVADVDAPVKHLLEVWGTSQ